MTKPLREDEIGGKCKLCGKWFRIQSWKEGSEREICFTCGVRQKVRKEFGLNEELPSENDHKGL